MASKMKKGFTVLLLLTVFFALSLGVLGYFFGVFSPVRITTGMRGPYLMTYMPHRGAYHRVLGKIEKVGRMLDKKHIAKTIPCAFFYDDPKDVPLEKLKSEGGYLVDEDLQLEHPFGQRKIPARGVIIATVKAHPMVAPFKTYRKIVEFMQMHRLDHNGPAMERYLPGGIVEVEMPFISPGLDQLRQTVNSVKFQDHSKKIPAHQKEKR